MSFGALILAAGEGKRMLSELPKVLHEVCGRPMLRYVLDAAKDAGASDITIVVGPGGKAIREAFAGEDVRWVVQESRLGTGNAVSCAAGALEQGPGDIIVICGDTPLITGRTLSALAEAFEIEEASAIVMTTQVDDPTGYGRIVRDEIGNLSRIVEEADATADESVINEINTGLYMFDRDDLLSSLHELDNANAQGEYYLTDVPAIMLARAKRVSLLMLDDPTETLGVNNPAELVEVSSAMQWRIQERLIASGVTIMSPENTRIDYDVTIGAGTRILPFTVIRSGVAIGRNCEVGPFTHLRAGTTLEDGAEVGNFTEVKASVIGLGTKAKHLSYLGDVVIGAGANIGAGTIIANYDGKKKHKTEIADGAFIGSGTILVAPVKVGKGAVTGAGSVVTRGKDVPDGSIVVGVPARRLEKGKEGAMT